MIGILFPGDRAYRPGIGRELHENFSVLGPYETEFSLQTGSTLADTVWYSEATAAGSSAGAKSAAVLAISCGFYQTFMATFPLPSPPVLIGTGTGVLAALVSAGALELSHGVAIALGATAQKSWFQPTDIAVASLDDAVVLRDTDDMLRAVNAIGAEDDDSQLQADALTRLGVEIALEIGPGDTIVSRLRPHVADTMITGALDTSVNAQNFLDTVAVQKYLNLRYLAERALGQLVGTRNRVGGTEGEDAVLVIGKRLRQLLAEQPLPTEPAEALSGRWTDAVVTIIDLWVENGRLKGYSPGEITASLRALENSTLLPVRFLAGYGAEPTSGHRKKEEGILAH
ncbi:hypothetical protein K2F54_18210 [Cryobacterium sp. 1639]|uniref:hypothetical protein n=1 Tax=Cryobacterium inferilacus TaxID=2866629 RepID=UPI001C730EF0|nr:hypothetical protein [Cryobacterium sp. 1639]MBX0301903.1 hypothetical protein [Cryobacterium sp. 1639]